MTTQLLKLNIGSGPNKIDGYESVDHIFGHEAFPLAYGDATCDQVYASNVLEHFPIGAVLDVLKEWFRVLAPGGRIRIAVPDGQYWAKKFADGEIDAMYRMHGGQTSDRDYHYVSFTDRTLRDALAQAGFAGIHTFEPEYADTSTQDGQLRIAAIKPLESQKPWIGKKIIGLMSMPRLGYTANFGSIATVTTQYGIDFRMVGGAFWGHGLERGIQTACAGDRPWAEFRDAYKRGEAKPACDWICFYDYDTVFSRSQFERLMVLFDTHREFDALAPVQIKREAPDVLANWGGDFDMQQFRENQISPAITAHFGCTFVRPEAILAMAKPWFWGKPNDEGEWGEFRMDDDIRFWHEFKNAGGRLGIASKISVGHIEESVKYMGKDGAIVTQRITDFVKDGVPKTVWG
jgi:predicted SAM-dependent methyltransferase